MDVEILEDEEDVRFVETLSLWEQVILRGGSDSSCIYVYNNSTMTFRRGDGDL